ncbi:uncharacterized protein DSM5745_06982 [Aspergillus mulundensis]|uniref:Cupin type-2 domain-containing protein n=1 Tax=Aspergillus mulundensis TaxID=1810919 RepID=A0A3D8RK21_9EURO|nr:Uncharacterized protein DSM5745_06982 [Aspergillus mulundensis]RDW74320.1 Uncharacterized protein DSM5745_06982 [Aspergillus mulundensis]
MDTHPSPPAPSHNQPRTHPTPAPAPAPQPQPQPIILSPSAITAQPPESFPTPSPGSPGRITNNLTWRTLLSTPQTPRTAMCAGLATCPPRSGSLALHRHTQAEIYYVTAGRGVVVIEGVEHEVQRGSVLFIPGDAEHGVLNRGSEELEWFYVFPTAGFGDVVYRFEGEGAMERAEEKEG